MNDPIVAEVRQHRDNHAKQFNYNIDAICADYRRKHNQYVEQLKQSKTMPTIKGIEHTFYPNRLY